MKRCKKCGESKPLDDFYRDAACRNGYRPECKGCNLAAKKRWYERNRRRAIDRTIAWQRENPEKYRAKQRAYRAAHPDMDRAGHLKRKFGLRPEDYARMLSEQLGGCAICGSSARALNLHVDHNHDTGAVRGLLCQRCNHGIGLLREVPELLHRAAEYLATEGQEWTDRYELTLLARQRARELTTAPV